MIRLLPHALGIAVAVAACELSRLAHGVHHCHLAAGDVLIPQRFIHGVLVYIVLEGLPGRDAFIKLLDLSCVRVGVLAKGGRTHLGGIRAGLVGKFVFLLDVVFHVIPPSFSPALSAGS